jgi:hypothetical protein
VAAKKAAKKSAKRPVKKVAKKATSKRTVKKAVKKSSARKSATKKSSAKRSVNSSVKSVAASYKVPAVPTRNSATKRISTEPTPVKSAVAAPAKNAAASKKSSSRTFITILAAIVLLALLVVSRNGSKNNSTTSDTAATPTASAAQSSESAAASTSAAPAAGHGAPQGIVAHYNANGATIYWTAPAESSGISNYQVEISSNGGAFKVASTVPATQLSLDIAAKDTTGWCSFRVSTIYSDGQVVGGKVFGLPGQWS